MTGFTGLALGFLALILVVGVVLWFTRPSATGERTEGLPWPDSRVAQVNGLTIHYVQSGRGPHLVLIHGIAASVYSWRLVRPLLGQFFTVTALDLPGFGHSDKPLERNYDLDSQTQTVLNFLSQIGVNKFYLVGSSMGGAISLWMAHQAPERVLRLVCISPAVVPGLMPIDLQWLVPLAPRLKNLATPRLVRHALKRVVTDHSLIHEESIRTYMNPYLDEGTAAQVFVKALKAVQDPRMPQVLPQIRTPVLFLWGEKDRLVPFRHQSYLRGIFPSAKFLSLATAGHHPMEDSPQWTSQSILDFLSENPGKN